MTNTWGDGLEPDQKPISAFGWIRIVLRASAIIALIVVCLSLLLLLRLIEKPLYGLRRPITPHITQFVCRNALRLMQMPLNVHGAPLHGRAAVVANHTSWLDVFVLNASKRVFFVSKAEVAGWPGIGVLARATGTLFIERNRRHAQAQTKLMQTRLLAGQKLLFFPEGTSTDGLQVLPFKTTLFASFLTPELRDVLYIQPVSVVYHAPLGEEARFYGWWGDMSFGPHLLSTLAAFRTGHVDVFYHPALKVSDYEDRKALAKACEDAVRLGHNKRLVNDFTQNR